MHVVRGPYFGENCQCYSIDLAPVLNGLIKVKGKTKQNNTVATPRLITAFFSLPVERAG